MVPYSEARTDAADRGQRRPAGGRRAALLRRRSGRALQRAGYAAGAGFGLYRSRDAAGFEQGAGDGEDYGGFLWTARYVGGLLLLRKQCRPVRRIDQVSA